LNQIKNSNNRRNENKISELLSALDGDIYSGIKIKNDETLISVNINTDGAPCIKSRSFSLWPMLSSVVELNPSCRDKFENIIIHGIWLYKSKPDKKFYEKSLEQLYKLKDSNFNLANQKIKLRSQSGLLDLPAKASLTNVKQFNGEFGCISCFHPGISCNKVRLYPIDKLYEKKTNAHYLKYSTIADQMNKNIVDKSKRNSVFGFYGKSYLNNILNIPEQIPFDYMHLVLQGLIIFLMLFYHIICFNFSIAFIKGHAKWLYRNIFFNKDLKEDNIYQGDNIKFINKVLCSIKLPHTIHRKPSKVEDNSKWKSSEIKIFLFFQSVPIFMYILPSWYLYRYIAYVIAIRILYEPIHDKKKIDIAEKILIEYIKDLEDTFFYSAYTYTIHAHLHLADQVRSHGPLHTNSAFCFEGALFNTKILLESF